MPKNKNQHTRKRVQSAKTVALVRPLQGIDQKSFVFNDIVPIIISNPGNNVRYRVIIQADVNGYTWQVQNPPGIPVNSGSNPYG